MTQPSIRVALADDDAMVRTALRRYLSQEADVQWVGEAADGIEAIALVQAQAVDVLLLDVSMPRLDGLDALPHLLAAAPQLRVLMLTGHADAQMEARALQQGARGYLHKGGDPHALAAAIRAVMASSPPGSP